MSYSVPSQPSPAPAAGAIRAASLAVLMMNTVPFEQWMTGLVLVVSALATGGACVWPPQTVPQTGAAVNLAINSATTPTIYGPAMFNGTAPALSDYLICWAQPAAFTTGPIGTAVQAAIVAGTLPVVCYGLSFDAIGNAQYAGPAWTFDLTIP